MERFVKTYAKKKGLLGQAHEICEGTSRLNKCQVRCVSAKVKRMKRLV